MAVLKRYTGSAWETVGGVSSSGPLGVLGYVQVTANQGTFTGATDLTGLTVTFTAVAGRRYRVTGRCLLLSSVTTDEVVLSLQETTTVLQRTGKITNAASGANAFLINLPIVPSAGAHTYKLAAARTVGSGNVTMYASATNPAFLLVEDIGAA